jgi:hypothetical protein
MDAGTTSPSATNDHVAIIFNLALSLGVIGAYNLYAVNYSVSSK